MALFKNFVADSNTYSVLVAVELLVVAQFRYFYCKICILFTCKCGVNVLLVYFLIF